MINLRELISDFFYRRKGIWINKHPRNIHREGPTQIVTPKTYKENRLVREFYGHGRLPCCGAETFIEGPSGGMSTNIRCGDCGKRYNITPVLGLIEEI